MKRRYVQFSGAALIAFPVLGSAAASPAFNCQKASGSVEQLICADARLSALDRRLADVYSEAKRKAINEKPPTLAAEQRGWIKGRNECWKSDDRPACVEREYRHRIAELQARYRLVPHKGPVFYACEGNPANEIVVTYFETDPPSLIAERGDQTSFMRLQTSASGARYVGRNESFWEHHGEARVAWGYGSKAMTCKVKS